LQSLACGKHRILTKTPKSRDVNVKDTFSFNDAFTSPLARIKIQQIANRVETQEEDRDTRAKVEEERKFLARVSSDAPHSGNQAYLRSARPASCAL
jgi:cullin 3